MEFTKKQVEAIEEIINRYKNKEKYTVISGYAGVGKSFLVNGAVQAMANMFDLDIDTDFVYACYTGKAAQVLLKKGNKPVMTLHKLLYDSFPRPNGGFIRKPKTVIEYKVVIVDECSMAPKFIVDLLLHHNCYVIFMGDPFQLPPVDKDQDNGLLATPHVFLDEILRQAQESEIIRLSMDVREGRGIKYSDTGQDVKVLSHNELSTGMLTWADQVICATNKTRIDLNNQMRTLNGHEGKVQPGDKLICLRNYWDILNDDGDPLVNGTIGYINHVYETFASIPKFANNGVGGRIEYICGEFINEADVSFHSIKMDKAFFYTGEKALDWKTAYKLGQSWKTMHLIPLEFTYGYAITCHKAQGSEWDKVLVYEEGFPFVKQEHARWLYTAVTRSACKVVLLR